MIRSAREGDRDAVLALWNCCFPDESGFNDYFFSHIFDLKTVLLYELDGHIAAMTQMLPHRMSGGEVYTYIYGACTHPEYRRRHLMSELLLCSFALDRVLMRAGSILIPAEPWLFDFYAQFGYQPAFPLRTTVWEGKGKSGTLSMLSEADIPKMNALYVSMLSTYAGHLVRMDAEWRRQLRLFDALGCGCVGVWSDAHTLDGYAFLWKPEDGAVYAQEVCARDAACRERLLAAAAAQCGVSRVRVSEPAVDGPALGCMKRYDGGQPPCVYMNLMLN